MTNDPVHDRRGRTRANRDQRMVNTHDAAENDFRPRSWTNTSGSEKRCVRSSPTRRTPRHQDRQTVARADRRAGADARGGKANAARAQQSDRGSRHRCCDGRRRSELNAYARELALALTRGSDAARRQRTSRARIAELGHNSHEPIVRARGITSVWSRRHRQAWRTGRARARGRDGVRAVQFLWIRRAKR